MVKMFPLPRGQRVYTGLRDFLGKEGRRGEGEEEGFGDRDKMGVRPRGHVHMMSTQGGELGTQKQMQKESSER